MEDETPIQIHQKAIHDGEVLFDGTEEYMEGVNPNGPA